MARKRVLYIITKSDTGGAQKYVRDLATNLDKNKFEAKILYGGTDLKWLSNKIKPHSLFLNDWLATFELFKTFRREQPNIIHLNSSKAGVLGSIAAWFYKLSLKLFPIPYSLFPRIVFTSHGWVFNPTNYISKPARWFYILLHKFAGVFQNKIINVSEYDRKIALKYKIAPSYKLVTIHNGIDPNITFLSREEARKEIIARLEIRDSRLDIAHPWVGSIGRLTPEKNYETLIKTAALMRGSYFLVIGSGSEHQKLKILIANYKLQDIFFIIPPSGEDAILLKAFDVFTLPSIKEGLPYTLLEAMSAGLAIAATPAGGITEAIIHEQTGLISPIKNPEVLAGNIKKLLNEKKLSAGLSASAKLKLRNDFSIRKMISETEKIYLAD